jgi:SAM-dependent methyltransferase
MRARSPRGAARSEERKRPSRAVRQRLSSGHFDADLQNDPAGGVHHVPARVALFAEIARILKPGGRFLFREPVSDFILWRALRWLIYRLSPMLDHRVERPLTYKETVPALAQAGFRDVQYRRHGLLGFCLFMNSDVLVVNRLFRFIPGIRRLVRLSTALDEAMLQIPGLRRAGLQVIGVARKPR